MGSFTIDCAVSGQTIADGDPVRILFIQRTGIKTQTITCGTRTVTALRNQKGSIGATEEWKPVLSSFRARYADYDGFSIAPADRDAFKAAMQEWLPALAEIPEDLDEPAIPQITATFDNDFDEACGRLFRAISQDCLFGFSPQAATGGQQIKISAIHESAWKHLVHLALSGEADNRPPAAMQDVAASVIACYDRALESERAFMERQNFAIDDDFRRETARIAVNRIRIEFSDPVPSLAFNYNWTRPLKPILTPYGAAVLSGKPRPAIVGLEAALEDPIVVHAMDSLLLRLRPSRYFGQDYENVLGSRFAALVDHVHKTVTQPDFQANTDSPSIGL